MAHWLAAMDRGVSLDQIATALRSSAEFATVTEARKLSLQTVRHSRALYAGVTSATPNTGGCEFIPTDYGFGPQATAAFNMFCCCAF